MQEIRIKGLDETVFYDECENGLKVFMWVKEDVSTFYGTLSVKYGSIYNKFEIKNKTYKMPPGLAHFLEHVKFNETKDFTAHDYYNSRGCDTNAFTTFDYTNYQVYGCDNPKENVVHLLDFVQNDYFTKKIISNEKGVIIEEAKMGEDDPYTVMLFNHLENIFSNYECRTLITGSPSDIKKISIDDIRLAFETFYHPENMFLIVTGNFNPFELITAIKENQANKKFKKYNSPIRIIGKENKHVNKVYEEKSINVTNRKIKVGIKISKKNFKKMEDIDIRLYLSILLKANFGSTSDFKDKLLTKLNSSISYLYEIFDDYVVVMITVDSDYKEEIIKMIDEKLDNIDISKKAFERMKKSNIAMSILDFEDVEIVNNMLQHEILNYGKVIDDLKIRYENLKYADMLKFISLLDLKERSYLVLNPIQK